MGACYVVYVSLGYEPLTGPTVTALGIGMYVTSVRPQVYGHNHIECFTNSGIQPDNTSLNKVNVRLICIRAILYR